MAKGDSSDASSNYSDKKVVEVAFSDEEAAALDQRVWRKIDWVVVPLVTMFYLLSWLVCSELSLILPLNLFQDRTNLGNARIAGLQKDLKLTNNQVCLNDKFRKVNIAHYHLQYSIALTVTFMYVGICNAFLWLNACVVLMRSVKSHQT